MPMRKIWLVTVTIHVNAKTPEEACVKTAELVRQLGAPVVGISLGETVDYAETFELS